MFEISRPMEISQEMCLQCSKDAIKVEMHFNHCLQRKCEQYWPDEGEKKYGQIDVKLTDTEMTSDFCIRTFEITKVSRRLVSVMPLMIAVILFLHIAK